MTSIKVRVQFLFIAFFAAMACHAQAQTYVPLQFSTWVQSTGGGNMTNMLSTNQVMEILSLSMDTSTAIDVTVNDQTVSFGTAGALVQPLPFVIAGPSTVVFRRTSSGGLGAMITYRISEKTSAPQRQPQTGP